MNLQGQVLTEEVMTESVSLSAAEMAANICSQTDQLDIPRRYMFMQWLLIHSRAIHSASEIRENLNVWLGSLPPESAEWEYKLIMGETTWWRELDERRLERIMLECLGHNP